MWSYVVPWFSSGRQTSPQPAQLSEVEKMNIHGLPSQGRQRYNVNWQSDDRPLVIVTSCDFYYGFSIASALLTDASDVCRVRAVGQRKEPLSTLARMGAETAVIDFGNEKSITTAFQHKTDCKVILSIGSNEERMKEATCMLQAIDQADVDLVCLLSQGGADPTSEWKQLKEFGKLEWQVLSRNGGNSCILRTDWVQTNFLFWTDATSKNAEFPLSFGSNHPTLAPLAMTDIAKAVTAIVKNAGTLLTVSTKRTFTLQGPDLVSSTQIVRLLNDALKNPVIGEKQVSREELKAYLVGLRDNPKRDGIIPPNDTTIETFLDYFDFVESVDQGRSHDMEDLTGDKGTSLQDFFKEYARYFRPE
ncbi:hypothetical protein BZG36_00562 [Bifiguratus adelaidae]|uniref:NmrA-like domain-containing protein n=1 Tax=Bifiguratus adelaidae TaxID=1938954 RepID=A0A261Y7I6_9FUNG|nr:hypothetical protein BZG36_00562 [Bifiguratus adelaidae]